MAKGSFASLFEAARVGNTGSQRDTQPTVEVPNEAPNEVPNRAPNPQTWAEQHGERYMRSRQLRGRLNTRQPLDILDLVDAYCLRYQTDKQDVVESALREFFAAHPITGYPIGNTATQLGTRVPKHDHDLIMKDDMIIFWEHRAGKRATAKDLQHRASVADVPDEIVREGIVRTFANAKTPVGSFGYCVPEIRKLAADPRRLVAAPPPVDPLAQLRVLAEAHGSNLDSLRTAAHRWGYTDDDVRTVLGLE